MKRYIVGLLMVIALGSSLFLTSFVEAARPIRLQSIISDNFDSYINDSVVGQGGWVSYANGNNFIVQGVNVRSRKKMLHINALGDSVITKFGNPLTDGRQSILVRTEDRNLWGFYPDGNAQVRISKGQSFASSIFLAVSFRVDGGVAYYDPDSDAYVNFASTTDNQWTRLDIEWRSIDKTARYHVNSGSWTNWLTFAGSDSFTDFDNVGFDFVLPSGGGGASFDQLQ